MLLTLKVTEVLKVEVCDSTAAVDDLDDHVDEGLTRLCIQIAHPGDSEVKQLRAV